MIKSIEINWYEGYGNAPQITIFVDKRPKNFIYVLKPVRDNQTIYFAESTDGICHFYLHNTKNEGGFYGREYELNLADGSKKKIKGPWSSRAEVMNEFGFGPIMDCGVHAEDDKYNMAGYGVKVEYIVDLIKKSNLPSWFNGDGHPVILKNGNSFDVGIRCRGGGLIMKTSSTYDGIREIDERYLAT